MFVDVIIRCQIYFVFLIFVVWANYENILTTKISRSTVRTSMHICSNIMTSTCIGVLYSRCDKHTSYEA